MTRIDRHGAEVLDELRPLWLAMVRHHAEVASELGGVRADEDSWRRRREHYADGLRRGGFVLVAREADGRAVGYAFVTVEDGSPTWAEPFTHVESLSVLPEARGRGIGAALVERADAEGGTGDLRLDVVASNAGARRLYERLGFSPDVIGLRRRR